MLKKIIKNMFLMKKVIDEKINFANKKKFLIEKSIFQ